MNLMENSFKYSRVWLHNMQLKSLVASLLLRTWQPVTLLAGATQAPERPRCLTGRYASIRPLEGRF